MFIATPLLLAEEAGVEVIKDKHGTEKTNQEEGKEKQLIEIKGSSANRRMNKKFSITTELTGFGPIPNFSTFNHVSLILGYFLNNRSLVNLEMRNFPIGNLNSAIPFGSITAIASGQSVGLQYKRFVGDSFYFSTGIDFMKYDFSAKGYGSFSGESFMANFTIGNQWQWDNFTLGCDWFGLVKPLTTRLYKESQGTVESDYFEDEKKSFKKYGTINLLRFYLGIAFYNLI